MVLTIGDRLSVPSRVAVIEIGMGDPLWTPVPLARITKTSAELALGPPVAGLRPTVIHLSSGEHDDPRYRVIPSSASLRRSVRRNGLVAADGPDINFLFGGKEWERIH
jgi:hypothetical protein